MLKSLIVYMQTIIAAYGAWGVFAATMMEEIIAPLPSPLVPLAAGFFLINAQATLGEALQQIAFSIAFSVASGIAIGSSMVYALGYFGGKPIIEKFRKWLGINWSDVEKAEKRLRGGKGDELVLFILRIIPLVPGVAISGLCGIIRYPFVPFLLVTCLGAFLRAFVLGLVGWKVGELYTVYADALEKIEKYLFLGAIVIILALLAFYVTKKIKARKRSFT